MYPTVDIARGPHSVTAAPSGTPLLRVEGVSKRFGAVAVLEDVSLTVHAGEIVTLLGPSGCGKSTLLRLVMGLDQCDTGAIAYDDRVLDSPTRRVFVPPERRQMGMVFQSYALWPHMTVFENVAYPLRARGVGGRPLTAQVDAALELVGLQHLAGRPATQLSGGQQQRVAFARSLVFHPRLLLLDEPFSNLDAHLREQMRVEVRLLQRQLGMAVLFVTHDQLEALCLADRLAVMSAGRIEQTGHPEALYDFPATPFVRDFLGKTLLLACQVAAASADGIVATLVGAPDVAVRATGPAPALLGPATRCQIAVRPERVAVRPGTGHAAGLNGVPATIADLFFVGDRYEARLDLPGAQSLLLQLPRDRAWQEGQAVTLEFAPEVAYPWTA